MGRPIACFGKFIDLIGKIDFHFILGFRRSVSIHLKSCEKHFAKTELRK